MKMLENDKILPPNEEGRNIEYFKIEAKIR